MTYTIYCYDDTDSLIKTITTANIRGGVNIEWDITNGRQDYFPFGVRTSSCDFIYDNFTDDIEDFDDVSYFSVGISYNLASAVRFYGYFKIDEITRVTDTQYKITAYELTSVFDEVIDDWLSALTFPMTMSDLIDALGNKYGISFNYTASDLIWNNFQVDENFISVGMTARDLLNYICQANLMIMYSNYTLTASTDEKEIKCILPDYSVTAQEIDNTKYTSVEIGEQINNFDKVIVRMQDNDVGVYSTSGTGNNPFVIQNNPLLYVTTGSTIQTYVDAMYTKLSDTTKYFSQTHYQGKVSGIYDPTRMLENFQPRITVEKDNVDYSLFINKCSINENGVTLEASGTVNSQSEAVAVNSSVQALNGRFHTINNTLDELDSTIGTKVGNNEIISKINQSAEAVTIQANKVNLTGYVTATDLATSGSTTINGSNITTGTIQSANGNYSVDLTNGSATLKNATITGGSVNINTSSSSSDTIKLSYNEWTNSMQPIGNVLTNSSTGYRCSNQAGGIFFSRNNTTKAVLRLDDSTYQPYLCFYSGSGVERAVLEISQGGFPYLALYDSAGTLRAQLNFNAYTGEPYLGFYDSSGTKTEGLGEEGLLCHRYTAGAVSVDHSSNNNVWVNGAHITVPSSGYYYVKARAQVSSNNAYCRYGVSIGSASGNYYTTELGSSNSAVVNNTIAYNGTAIEASNLAYYSYNDVLYCRAVAKGAGGGSGGTSNTWLYLTKIG